MDLKKLHYLVSVAEAGSFSNAAQNLGIAQPALSQQIAALERDLGVDLFYRTGRGVVATEAGTELVARAKSILSDVDRARYEISVMHGNPQGRLALGVPPSVSHALVADFVLAMNERFPRIRLNIIEAASGYVREWLSQGRLDIGILYQVGPDPLAQGEELLVEDLSLVGRVDDPLIAAAVVPFERIAQLPLILPGRPHGLRTLLDTIARQRRLELTAVMELDGAALVRSLVASGCGYSILPDITVRLDMPGGRIGCSRIVDPPITRRMVIAGTNESRSRAATRLAIGLMRDLVANRSIPSSSGGQTDDTRPDFVPVN